MRANVRYRYHSWTATRATSKSFIAYLSAYLRCIFLPGTQEVICSDVKGTVIKTANAKFTEIWRHWPLLKNELMTQAEDGKKGDKMTGDYVEFKFKNGSTLSVISIDTTRGLRATGVIAEESALIDGEDYNAVIKPMLNVSRRGPDGFLDPDEPHNSQVFITTAGPKTCWMYQQLIELVIMSILRPDEYFVWGLSYQVPVKYGLLDKRYLDEQRLSSTYSSETFARESMSIWTGNANDSWFNSSQLVKYRKILKCERKATKDPANPHAYYVISVDVGRYRANSVIMVFKVLPKEEFFYKKLVYTEVINGENLFTQAAKIKRMIKLYNPAEVVIDGNGLTQLAPYYRNIIRKPF